MPRSLPPLNPLRVFEAAARHVHFTRAAEELGITQAAVSRQILVLEGWLKVKLFERNHPDVRLTEAGKRYLTSLGQAFDLIESSTADALGGSKQSTIVLRAYSTFAMRWLIPRLPRFTRLHPDILIDIKTAVVPITFRPDETGLIIDCGTGEMEGVVSQRVIGDVIVPICHPKLLQGAAPEEPADLGRYPLLHSRPRRHDWADWFTHVGAKAAPNGGSVFDNSSLTYQAAKEGIGIAMGQIHLLEAELANGELIIPIDRRYERSCGYYLHYPERVRQDPRVIAFHNWMIEEAAAQDARIS